MCGVVEGCLGSFATKRTLGTIRKEKGISSPFQVSISCDMTYAVESVVKPHSVLPFFVANFLMILLHIVFTIVLRVALKTRKTNNTEGTGICRRI